MTFIDWTADEAADHIAIPVATDDKYSRGVLGVVTGSVAYPGAAVLGVEAALHTGVGMLRFVGADSVGRLVLARRPEVVTSVGRVQAWLVGSGMDKANRDSDESERLERAFSQGLPMVVDAGALDLIGTASGPLVITPHFGELARVLDEDKADIAARPADAAVRAADRLGMTVLVKGSTTFVADPHGSRLQVRSATPWTATAGAGDALGGILGALVATHSREIEGDPTALARLAATAAVVHADAAARASGGGPFTVLDLAGTVSSVVGDLVRGRR